MPLEAHSKMHGARGRSLLAREAMRKRFFKVVGVEEKEGRGAVAGGVSAEAPR